MMGSHVAGEGPEIGEKAFQKALFDILENSFVCVDAKALSEFASRLFKRIFIMTGGSTPVKGVIAGGNQAQTNLSSMIAKAITLAKERNMETQVMLLFIHALSCFIMMHHGDRGHAIFTKREQTLPYPNLNPS